MGGMHGIMLAAETLPDMGQTMTDAFQKCATQSITQIGAIAPIALSIFICRYLWGVGKKFFKDMGK